MFKINFPTKRIFRVVYVFKTNRMTPFCNLLWYNPHSQKVANAPWPTAFHTVINMPSITNTITHH